jgi:hypothetical protein
MMEPGGRNTELRCLLLCKRRLLVPVATIKPFYVLDYVMDIHTHAVSPLFMSFHGLCAVSTHNRKTAVDSFVCTLGLNAVSYFQMQGIRSMGMSNK